MNHGQRQLTEKEINDLMDDFEKAVSARAICKGKHYTEESKRQKAEKAALLRAQISTLLLRAYI